MGRRNNNNLPNNLAQLQRLINNDNELYKEEFLQQYNQYKSLIEIFKLKPEEYEEQLANLLMFLAQVSHHYSDILVNYPQELVDILKPHHTILDPDMRMSFCKALVLLRIKNLLSPTDLLSLFFQLLNCQDKHLRAYLKLHIIIDIKKMNQHHKNGRINKVLQNFMYSMLGDSNSKAAKMSIDIMIELYKKNIWNDAKTVNVIASGCYSKFIKVMVTCLKFFLGNDEDNKDGSDSDSDVDQPTAKEVSMANKVNKKTRKREKLLGKAKKAISKNKRKKNKAEVFNFSALHLVHDPQGMAERLLISSSKATERFEVRLMALDVCSRLIGVHQLIVLNLYPQLQKLLNPRQREVTHILRCAAQAAHPLVPPENLEPLLKTMSEKFVTERNNNDAIAIGLNAIRELCARCPLAISQELLHDLAQFSTFRDRSVSMAAKALIKLYRVEAPQLLLRKNRGRPTQITAKKRLLAYGEIDAADHVPGADILDENVPAGSESQSDSDSDDDSWVDVDNDKDEISISDSDEESNTKGKEENIPNPEKAQQVSTMRILTDEDFKKIEIARLRAEITPFSRKRSLPQNENTDSPNEIVSMADIENIYKKRRHDKEARLEKLREEQTNKEKFGHRDKRENTGSTNREKNKKKNFLMLKHKFGGKVKKSFKDKQIALRNHLIKLKKMH